jgi:glucokinase
MTDPAQHYVGVDLGGTKILALVVTVEGEVLSRAKRSTTTGDEPISDQIAAAIDDALDEAGLSVDGIAGIGVAIPGVVDSQTGYMMTVPNLDIDDPQMVDVLRDRYDLPVAMANDVNLGTLAECWLGAGKGADSAVGIFVGTGIGGGVVIDGRMRTGEEDMAGEIGHMVLMVDGPVCGCGNLGCFEALASRTAIERDIRAALDEGRESCVMDFAKEGRLKSGALAKALEAGDELVTEVLTRDAHLLAQGVLTIRHLLDPELIIFGGGVIEACGEFLMPLIEEEVRDDCMRGSRDSLRLVVSELGDDAVALGAAVFARAEIDGLSLDQFEAQTLDDDDDEVAYPRIDHIEFGAVVIDGKEIARDVHITGSGKLRKRKKKRLRKTYGTSHVVDGKEIAKVCKGNPALVIIGRGFEELVSLTDDAREYLDTLGIDYALLPSPEAVELYNETTGPKALILHVTC